MLGIYFFLFGSLGIFGKRWRQIYSLIEKLKSDQPDETFFVDEANFMTCPYLQRGWFKRQDKNVSSPIKESIQNNRPFALTKIFNAYYSRRKAMEHAQVQKDKKSRANRI